MIMDVINSLFMLAARHFTRTAACSTRCALRWTFSNSARSRNGLVPKSTILITFVVLTASKSGRILRELSGTHLVPRKIALEDDR
jgi:hypothetical protein